MTREETLAKLTALIDEVHALAYNCGSIVSLRMQPDASEYAYGLARGRTHEMLSSAAANLSRVRAEIEGA